MIGLVEEFKDVDAELRVLATLGPKSWDIQYIAESLQEVYSETDFEESYRHIMGNQVSSDDFSQIVQAGGFTGHTYVFDNVVIFQFPSSRYEGVFVSYTRGNGFPAFDVIEIAEQIPIIE